MNPTKPPFVVFGYKKTGKGISHVGLGVNAMHSVSVLRAANVRAEAHGMNSRADLEQLLKSKPDITHVVIEALWMPTADLEILLHAYPDHVFTVRCHSQLAFLQIEPGAVRLMREGMQLQSWAHNFRLSANNIRLCEFIEQTYNTPCLHLPNLYQIARAHVPSHSALHGRDRLRIASFGALRLQKHHVAAAGAALQIANRLGKELRFHINVGREEGGGGSIAQAIRNLFDGLPWAKVVPVQWASWGQFRETVAHMDLCIHLSASETFNLCTADAVAEMVPCVTGPAIEWVPRRWIADIDDTADAARVGISLLHDPHAAQEGWKALSEYTQRAKRQWATWVRRNPVVTRIEA